MQGGGTSTTGGGGGGGGSQISGGGGGQGSGHGGGSGGGMIRVTRFRTVTDPGVGGSRYVYFFTGTPWSLDGLGTKLMDMISKGGTCGNRLLVCDVLFATVDRRSTEKVTRSVGA